MDHSTSLDLGGGWQVQPVLPGEAAILVSAHEAEVESNDAGALLGGMVLAGAAWVTNGRAVVGVVYRRESLLAHCYSGGDHAN